MKEQGQILTTKVFLLLGTLSGGYIQLLEDLDLIFGTVLKFVSVVSFVIVIVINLPKFVEIINKARASIIGRNKDQ